MRKLILVGLVLGALLSGCGGDGSPKASPQTFEAADKYAIAQLQTRWHEANSTKNIEEVMALFADDAILTVGGQTYTGKDQIQNFVLTKSGPFRPENRWTSLHPAFKVRISSVEDRGTIHFECHYVDVATQAFKSSVAADAKVARVKDQWLFTSLVASNATLS
jgi:hypothetical protein